MRLVTETYKTGKGDTPERRGKSPLRAMLRFCAMAVTLAAGLAQGVSAREVMVRIDRSGVYSISNERLRQLGFDNPSKAAVYGFPAQALSTNNFGNGYRSYPALAQSRTDAALEFYAEGPVRVEIAGSKSAKVSRNTYSSGNYYLLSDEKEAEIAESQEMPTGETVTTHLAATLVEEETVSPAKIGTFFYGPEIKDGTATKVSYSLDRPVQDKDICHIFKYCGSGPEVIRVRLGAPSGFKLKKVKDRAISVDDSSLQYYDYATNTYTLTPSGDAGKIELSYTALSAGEIEFARLDYGICLYERENGLDRSRPWIEMDFEAAAGKQAGVTVAAGCNVCSWSLDNPFGPMRLAVKEGEGTCTIAIPSTADGNGMSRVLAWLSGEAYPEPEIIGTTGGDPEIKACDGLIVCSLPYIEEARELAEVHKRQLGLELMSVCQEDIFHKYSSSTPHAMAVRMYTRDLMLKSKDEGREFRGIILYGTGSWDQRGIIYDVPGKVVTYNVEDESDASLKSADYSTDQYFGFLEDVDFSKFKDTEMTVPVGRIPVTNLGQARMYNRKVERLLAHPAPAYAPNSLLVMSDDGDANLHLNQMENIAGLFSEKRPGGVVYKAHNMLFPWKNNLAITLNKYTRTGLERGVGMMFAASHGNPTGMAQQVIWNYVMARDTKYSNPPFMLLATCNAFNFDRQSGSFGEELLFNPEGGASALVTSSRKVYMDYNFRLCKEVLNALQTADKPATAGEIFRRARNAMVGVVNSRSLITNVLCYQYFGTPFLPAPVVTSEIEGLKIEVADSDSPGGYRALEGESINLPTGCGLRVSGLVTGAADGESGEVCLTVLESPYELTTYVRGNEGDSKVKVSMRDRELAHVTEAAVGREFSINFTLPESAENSADKVMTVSYSSADGNVRAVADVTSVAVTAAERQVEQTSPRISALYINDPGFTEGDMVSSESRAILEIESGASGLYSNTAGVGKGLRVRLDGHELTRVTAGTLRNAGKGKLATEIDLGTLAPGRHTLSADIKSNDDAGDCRDISFIVKPEKLSLPAVRTDVATATESVEIRLEGELPEGISGTWRINIDGDEGTVRTIAPASFPVKWDFTDDGGKKQPSGIYRIRAWFTPDGSAAQATVPVKVTYIPVDVAGEKTETGQEKDGSADITPGHVKF